MYREPPGDVVCVVVPPADPSLWSAVTLAIATRSLPVDGARRPTPWVSKAGAVFRLSHALESNAMWFIRGLWRMLTGRLPCRSFEDVCREMEEGLNDGSIVVDTPKEGI